MDFAHQPTQQAGMRDHPGSWAATRPAFLSHTEQRTTFAQMESYVPRSRSWPIGEGGLAPEGLLPWSSFQTRQSYTLACLEYPKISWASPCRQRVASGMAGGSQELGAANEVYLPNSSGLLTRRKPVHRVSFAASARLLGHRRRGRGGFTCACADTSKH